MRKTNLVGYLVVLSQTLFTIAVGLAFYNNDKILNIGILIFGFILLALSYFTLILPVVLNKKRMKRVRSKRK